MVFQGVLLFQAVRLFFLPNFPGGTFIPDGTVIPYYRVSLKRGTVCLCGAIKPEDTHKNVFSVISQLLHFCNKILRGREFIVVVT